VELEPIDPVEEAVDPVPIAADTGVVKVVDRLVAKAAPRLAYLPYWDPKAGRVARLTVAEVETGEARVEAPWLHLTEWLTLNQRRREQREHSFHFQIPIGKGSSLWLNLIPILSWII